MTANARAATTSRAGLVLQIVPELPPRFEGVGSYALQLGAALEQYEGWSSRYRVGNPDWRPASQTEGLEAVAFGARNEESLWRDLERESDETVVLLHYANYGYHPQGCPDWLIAGLERWLGGAPRRRLVTFFHEVYASGPPWRRAFWQGRHQRRLAARLVRISDGMLTTLEIYRRLLAPWAGGKEVEILPISSSVGEPTEVPPLADRRRRLVVFGGPGNRERAYGLGRAELETICRMFGVEEVCDAGASARAPARVGDVPLRVCGPLPAEALRALLLSAQIGFMAYPPDFLPKSTIYAAYSACGMLPVCADQGRIDRSTGSSRSGIPPYWSPGDAQPSPEGAQSVATRAHAWYQTHDLRRQSEVIGRLLRGPGAVA